MAEIIVRGTQHVASVQPIKRARPDAAMGHGSGAAILAKMPASNDDSWTLISNYSVRCNVTFLSMFEVGR